MNGATEKKGKSISRRLSFFHKPEKKQPVFKTISEDVSRSKSQASSPTEEKPHEIPTLSQSMPDSEFRDETQSTDTTPKKKVSKSWSRKSVPSPSTASPPDTDDVRDEASSKTTSETAVSVLSGSTADSRQLKEIAKRDKREEKERKKEEERKKKEEKERKKKEGREKKKVERTKSKGTMEVSETNTPDPVGAVKTPNTAVPAKTPAPVPKPTPPRTIASPVPLPTPKYQSLSGYGSRFSSHSSYNREVGAANKAGRALPTVTRSGATSPTKREVRRAVPKPGDRPRPLAVATTPPSRSEFRPQPSPMLRHTSATAQMGRSLRDDQFQEIMGKIEGGEVTDAFSDDEEDEPLLKVVAVYDYEGTQPDELTFWEGDIVTVLAEFEDGWWLGLRAESNTMGRVPSNFLQPLPVGIFAVRAVADFRSEEEGDLSFETGDIMVVTHREENWWYGEIQDDGGVLVGWIPSNYVEDVDIETRGLYGR